MLLAEMEYYSSNVDVLCFQVSPCHRSSPTTDRMHADRAEVPAIRNRAMRAVLTPGMRQATRLSSCVP